MIKAVLLDLDDTLLRLEVRSFIEQYNLRLSRMILFQVPELVQEDGSIRKTVREGIQAVLTNVDPVRTNQDVFRQTLSRRLDIASETLQRAEDRFFNSEYQHLQPLVATIPAAAALVEDLFARNLAVVIATNPVFPMRAVKGRMAWAGLNPERPYALITALEGMHFTKPNPHYYEEILARIGVEPDEALMVGDNPTHDIAAARQAGLYTFWIDDAPEQPADPGAVNANARGSLADFAARIQHGWLSELPTSSPSTPDQVIPRLIGNIGALDSLIRLAEPKHWHMRPDPNEWSPLEILCHMRDAERGVHRPRLQRIAAEDNPFLTAAATATGPTERDLSGEEPVAVFRDFWAERQRTISFLASLKREDWQRPARHSIFGPTTLLEMAYFTARHDHLHITQLCQTIGRCGEQ